MRRWLHRGVTLVAFAYPVALAAIALLLRLLGERWWVTAAALYLPRIAFALPAPVIAAVLLGTGRFRLLLTQLVAGLVWLFPLMGLALPLTRSAPEPGPTVRVLSINANSADEGVDALLGAIDFYAPDLVLMQEIEVSPRHPLLRGLAARYKAVSASTQFIIASRFPLSPLTDPDKLVYGGKPRAAGFVRVVVETPLGAVAVYDVHPISPREGFSKVRGRGLREEIRSGRFFAGAGGAAVQANSGLRALQVDDIAVLAKGETMPLLIAGDTNLPGLSPLLARLEDGYRDGFRAAGWGFGYTFPAARAWMRIDRILASPALRFRHFEVGCAGASDHLCVVADVASAANAP